MTRRTLPGSERSPLPPPPPLVAPRRLPPWVSGEQDRHPDYWYGRGFIAVGCIPFFGTLGVLLRIAYEYRDLPGSYYGDVAAMVLFLCFIPALGTAFLISFLIVRFGIRVSNGVQT